jgi:WD40 repeat protein
LVVCSIIRGFTEIDIDPVAGNTRSETKPSIGQVKIWTVPTGKHAEVVTPKALPVEACSFGADGKSVTFAFEDGMTAVWDRNALKTGAHRLGKRVEWAQFSCGGKAIAAGGDDKYVRLWDSLDMGVKHFCIGTDMCMLFDWFKANGGEMKKLLCSGPAPSAGLDGSGYAR